VIESFAGLSLLSQLSLLRRAGTNSFSLRKIALHTAAERSTPASQAVAEFSLEEVRFDFRRAHPTFGRITSSNSLDGRVLYVISYPIKAEPSMIEP